MYPFLIKTEMKLTQELDVWPQFQQKSNQLSNVKASCLGAETGNMKEKDKIVNRRWERDRTILPKG